MRGVKWMSMKLPNIIVLSIASICISFFVAFVAFLYIDSQSTLPGWLTTPIYLGSIGIFACITMTWMISRHVAKQLHILISFAESVTKGDLKQRIDHTSYIEEINTLTRKMNEMTVTADTLTNTLEKKVEERTKDIEAAKRDTELKLVELDRMNKIMVGRELKMIELKKQLQTLTHTES